MNKRYKRLKRHSGWKYPRLIIKCSKDEALLLYPELCIPYYDDWNDWRDGYRNNPSPEFKHKIMAKLRKDKTMRYRKQERAKYKRLKHRENNIRFTLPGPLKSFKRLNKHGFRNYYW